MNNETRLLAIVLDASALLELLLATPTGLAFAERIADPADSLHRLELGMLFE